MYFDDKDLREDQSFEMPQGESLGGVEGGMDEEYGYNLLRYNGCNCISNAIHIIQYVHCTDAS